MAVIVAVTVTRTTVAIGKAVFPNLHLTQPTPAHPNAADITPDLRTRRSIELFAIDYGLCAFMDTFHPATVFSSIDHGGRYAYGNQRRIVQWNLRALRRPCCR